MRIDEFRYEALLLTDWSWLLWSYLIYTASFGPLLWYDVVAYWANLIKGRFCFVFFTTLWVCRTVSLILCGHKQWDAGWTQRWRTSPKSHRIITGPRILNFPFLLTPSSKWKCQILTEAFPYPIASHIDECCHQFRSSFISLRLCEVAYTSCFLVHCFVSTYFCACWAFPSSVIFIFMFE